MASVLYRMLVMIIAVLRLLPMADQRESVIRILESMVAETRAKLGCNSCGTYVDCGFSHCIVYVEEWTSEEEMYRHIQSSLYMRLLTAMDLCKDPPELSFHHVTQTEHLELVEALRVSNANSV